MSATAPARVEPSTVIAQVLTRYKPVVRKLLAPTTTSEETFLAQVSNALRATPKLWECDPETVLGAALRCAQLNLAPNDGTNAAWIIPYGRVATFQLGYGGVVELARRAVPGLRFDGRPVYPNDEFDLDYGRTPPLKHTPSFARKPPQQRGGEAFAWYVRAIYPDGTEQVQMLDREGVEYHRSFSKQRDGDLWTKSYDAAALKSVVLDMKRWLPTLPTSPALADAVAADNQVHDLRDMAKADYIRAAPDDDAEWVDAEQGGE